MTHTTGTHHFTPDPRNDAVLIDINGTHVPRPDAKISVFDRNVQSRRKKTTQRVEISGIMAND